MAKTQRIAICGASSVGKTTLFKRLTNGEYDHDHYVPTMGVDCNMNFRSSVIYYDFSGDESYYRMTVPYIRNTDLFLMVYNIHEKSTLDTLDVLYKKYIELGWSGEIILVGNKKDQSTSNMLLDNILLGETFAEKIQVPHFTISAKTGEDIYQLENSINFMINPEICPKATFYMKPKHRKKSCFSDRCMIL